MRIQGNSITIPAALARGFNDLIGDRGEATGIG
jgi:hypothetical protein